MTIPLIKSQTVTVYALVKLDSSGKFSLESSNVTEQGDWGVGFYSKKETAQYQQVILALKNIKVEIYELEHPL